MILNHRFTGKVRLIFLLAIMFIFAFLEKRGVNEKNKIAENYFGFIKRAFYI